jgi:O-antigen ligase
MFWLAMYDKRVLWKRFFLLMATIGFLMILLSGTRNATVATLIGVGALWWVFRDRLLVYIGIMAVFGLLIQISVGASETAALGDRLASTENQRLDVWIMYFGLALNSPFIGYGPDGLVPAIYGDSVAALISIAGRAYTPGVHNHYLGFAVRYGFIGLFIFLALLLMPIICAWKVVFSKVVSEADKKVYIMPAALLGIVILEGLFEDNVGSTGRGTLHGIALGFAVPLVLVYGRRLLNEAGTDQLERKK